MRATHYWDKATQTWIDCRTQSGPEAKVYIQDDTMEPTRHPATGEMMDSKSRFRAETKARGLTEVGNEWVGKPWQPVEPKFPDLKPLLRELLD